MEERTRTGFHIIESQSLELLDEAVNDFLDNALISKLIGPIDVKRYDYMRPSMLNPQHPEMYSVYMATITFAYDKAMNDKIEDENQTTLAIEQEEKKEN